MLQLDIFHPIMLNVSSACSHDPALIYSLRCLSSDGLLADLLFVRCVKAHRPGVGGGALSMCRLVFTTPDAVCPSQDPSHLSPGMVPDCQHQSFVHMKQKKMAHANVYLAGELG